MGYLVVKDNNPRFLKKRGLYYQVLFSQALPNMVAPVIRTVWSANHPGLRKLNGPGSTFLNLMLKSPLFNLF